MVEKIYRYPDDDGRRQRAWVTDCEERGRGACERVLEVLRDRPWVREAVETVRGEVDDKNGTDIFMEINERLISVIGMWDKGQPIAVQVKSSENKQRKFGRQHRGKVFNVKKKEHIFVLDGQDAMDVITADLMGQMIVLVCLSGMASEEGLLKYFEEEMKDGDMVARYKENRELLLDTKWYGKQMV